MKPNILKFNRVILLIKFILKKKRILELNTKLHK